LGGLLGAGLFGMLFGSGFFSGLAGFGSIIGLLLQIGLIVIVGRLLFNWWQRRSRPAYAGMQGGMNSPRSALGGLGGGFGFGGGNATAPASEPLQTAREDFDTFERLLGEIQ